jgi:hypothetical protein
VLAAVVLVVVVPPAPLPPAPCPPVPLLVLVLVAPPPLLLLVDELLLVELPLVDWLLAGVVPVSPQPRRSAVAPRAKPRALCGREGRRGGAERTTIGARYP